MNKITIGKLSFELSKQAKVVFYAWAVILAAMFVVILLNPKTLLLNLFVFVLYVFVAILSVYAVNCYVVGNCNTLAWIASAFSIVSAVMYVITAIFITFLKVKKIPYESMYSIKKSKK